MGRNERAHHIDRKTTRKRGDGRHYWKKKNRRGEKRTGTEQKRKENALTKVLEKGEKDTVLKKQPTKKNTTKKKQKRPRSIQREDPRVGKLLEKKKKGTSKSLSFGARRRQKRSSKGGGNR